MDNPNNSTKAAEEKNTESELAPTNKKILEGEELPHQKNDVRPEDIVEHEQEPLAVPITEEDKKTAVSTPPYREKGEEEDELTPGLTPHLEKKYHQTHLKEKKMISEHRQDEKFSSQEKATEESSVEPSDKVKK
jgi:hypothetical protein